MYGLQLIDGSLQNLANINFTRAGFNTTSATITGISPENFGKETEFLIETIIQSFGAMPTRIGPAGNGSEILVKA